MNVNGQSKELLLKIECY